MLKHLALKIWQSLNCEHSLLAVSGVEQHASKMLLLISLARYFLERQQGSLVPFLWSQ